LAKAGRISEQPLKSSQLLSYLLHAGERHTSTQTIGSLEELVNHIKDAKRFTQAANESHHYHQENSNSTTTQSVSTEQIFGQTGIEGVSEQTLDNFSFIESELLGDYGVDYRGLDNGAPTISLMDSIDCGFPC
jgi:hypothetical protein